MPYVFTRDNAGVSEILKQISAEAVLDLARQVAASAGTTAVVESKVSQTRFVAIVKVPAEDQATDGVLSRAASAVGLTIKAYKNAKSADERKRVIGFVSKKQWRWAFWSEKPWALGKARDTPGGKLIRYRQLPDATGRDSTPK